MFVASTPESEAAREDLNPSLRPVAAVTVSNLPDARRGPQSPLAYFPVCTTHDLDEARTVISQLYFPFQLEIAESRALDLSLNAVDSGKLTLGYCNFGVDTILDAPVLENWYHINITLKGRTSVQLHRRRKEIVTQAGTHGVIFTPADAVSLRWPAETSQLVLKVSASALHDHLSGLLGAPSEVFIDFHPDLDLSSAAGTRLGSAIGYYASELQQARGRMNPIVEGQFEALLMTNLLFSSPHQYTEALVEGPRFLRPRVVQCALDYVHAHISEPIGSTDLARAADTSARSLQVAFRRHLGATPTAVIRDLRLTRVHEELCQSNPEAATVGALAVKWGFLHQGRFGQEYRARYGCRPGETLRRHY